jgi:N4-(beta-N-acetylglucosaminyl)-L-asparaginase
MDFTRRKFITTAAVGAAALGIAPPESAAAQPEHAGSQAAPGGPPQRPVLITKVTGKHSLDEAYQMLLDGADTLEACLHVNKAQEDDPNDDTVGLGGLPNEEGVVELDSCCMHGPTHRAGSVGGLREIKNACLVAKAVMTQTHHVMLVAEGAQKFAVEMGFPRENLLTERSRKIWLLWKQTMSNQDWWGPGMAAPDWKPPVPVPPPPKVTGEWQRRLRRMEAMAADLGIPPQDRMHAIDRVLHPPTGTIHTSAVNTKGEMSGSTTTSGLAWKIPGRVGDSPIIGAGCFTDQEVGSAGATGSGEENIEVAGAHTIIENMRKGMSPVEAGLDACRRLVKLYNGDMNRVRFIDMVYYILRKDGVYAGVSLWGSAKRPRGFAVHDGGGSRVERTVALFEGESIDWPPIPRLPKE